MRRVAGSALTVAAAFLSLMAILIDAPALFYMSFALIATLAAANFQARLATRALRIERLVPASVAVGERATVEMVVWSERRIKRPLVTVADELPARMRAADLTPSLPIAPSFDGPIRTQYRFRPMKRGRFRLSRVEVTGTDALGLVVKTVPYETAPAEIVVVPRPLPLDVELPSGSGWGASEAQTGTVRGAGIEVRGLREYAAGDSLRYVDWRSSARTGALQVKEFEAGTHGRVAIVLQRHPALDGSGVPFTAFDAMCGHALGVALRLMRQGVAVGLPDFEPEGSGRAGRSGDDPERAETLARLLGEASASGGVTLAESLRAAAANAERGAGILLLAGVDDGTLDEALRLVEDRGAPTVLLYDPGDYDPSFRGRGLAAPETVDALRRRGIGVALVPRVASEEQGL